MYRSTNKKNIFFFFSQTFFFQHFLKSHRFFFFPTESKESSVHEQATTEFLIMSCEQTTRPLKFISSLKQKNKHKKQDQLPAAYLGHYVTQTAFHI